MKKTILVAFVAAFTWVSCTSNSNSGSNNESAHHHDHDHEGHDHGHATNDASFVSLDVPKSAITAPVLDAYFAVKIALQEDNQVEAAKAGEALTVSLASLSDDEAVASVKEIVETIKGRSEHIAKSDIAQQREHFEPLSHDMLVLVQTIGTDRDIYEQYCPMYNDNKGGMWLSNQEELLNPLFGSSMLKCGTTKQKITPID